MEQLEFSQPDTPASLSVWPGGVEARTMTAISGRKFFGLLTNAGRIGFCVKTLLATSQWGSTLCYLTWKARATPAGRLLFQLVPRMPRTGATESGLLPTPMTTDAKNNGGPGMMNRNTPQLNAAAVMLATPTTEQGGARLRETVSGKLNADFVEAMMGFPVGWTLIESGKRRPSVTKRGRKPGQASE